MMKKILLSMAVLLAVGGTVPSVAQRHRHTPRAAVVDMQNGSRQSEGVEAYSDTSSVADAGADSLAVVESTSVDDSNRYSPGRFDDPFSWFAFMCSSGAFGILLTILIVVLSLLFLFMPLIIVLLIIRYLVRRHNDRMRIAEKAMESGQSVSEERMPLSRKSPDYMWRRGVLNVSIGVGLMLLFWFMGTEMLVGVGGLVACLGAGQMFMVRYNYNSRFGRGRRRDDGMDDDLGGDISVFKFDDGENKR